MEPGFRSLLYTEPHLYDVVFPDTDGSLERMCRDAFRRYMPAAPASALDIGCGTARSLDALAETVAECWGVDLLDTNVAYARATRPRLHVVQGDMRTVRLGRTFDLVTSFGNALSYALTDGDGFRERIDGRVDAPELRATSVAMHVLDRRARLLKRTRVWRIPGRPDVEDYAEYRLLYPDELERGLEAAGFAMLALFDNRELRSSDLRGTTTGAPDPSGMRGRKLYAFARRRP